MEQSWVAMTLGLIDDLQAKRDKLEAKLAEVHAEIDEIDMRIRGAKGLIQEYRFKFGAVVPVTLDDIEEGCFGNMSFPEMMEVWAEKHDGYLQVIDLVNAILKSGFSQNTRYVQASIYSTLKRKKGKFSKIRPGEYRLVGANGTKF